MCNVYRSDIGKLCDAEQLSQGSLKGNKGALTTWMERNVASSEGVIFVRTLESKDTRGIGVQLRDEARKVGLPSCTLADQAEMQAKDEDYRTDIVNLCAGSAPRADGSVARLDVLGADDAERMRELAAWSATNAKSLDTAGIVAKLGATGPRQRGNYLRAEAAKVNVTSCLMASTLDALPPPPPPPVSQVNPNFTVLKVDGPAKNQLPIAYAVVGRDAAAAINACYAIALSTTPTLAGKASFKVVIDGSGHVVKASDDGSSVTGPVVGCIATALGTVSLALPPPDGGKKGTKASITLQLTPSSAGPGYGATTDQAWLTKVTPRHR
jgi:hypothetical protein